MSLRFYRVGSVLSVALALVLCLGVLALAGAPAPKKVSVYFHGSELASKLGRNHNAHVTVKYDGKQVMSRAFYSNSGFGGFTVTDVSESGKIDVHTKIFDKSGNLVAEKHWNQNFGNGTHDFFLEGNPRYWAFYMYMKRNGNDVEVKFG